MKRSRFDQTACDSLADCIREIEDSTAAELVIVVRARSGSYSHADYLFGALLALAGILFLVFSPFTFHQVWVVIDAVLLFVIGTLLSARSNKLRRLLTTAKYRMANVRTAAAAMFYEAGIANTEKETGVLIYLSLFERRLELIADRAVLKAVPALDWNAALFELHQDGTEPDPQTFLTGVKKLGALLTSHLPAADANPNELPNVPRFDLK
jgi:putative membrane protein